MVNIKITKVTQVTTTRSFEVENGREKYVVSGSRDRLLIDGTGPFSYIQISEQVLRAILQALDEEAETVSNK